MSDKFTHTGGVFVEAMSVCFPGKGPTDLNEDCINEARWAANELEKSDKQYVLCPSACLEDPNVDKTLEELAKNPNVRGIR